MAYSVHKGRDWQGTRSLHVGESETSQRAVEAYGVEALNGWQGACTLQLSYACSWVGIRWRCWLSPKPSGPPEPRRVLKLALINTSQPEADGKEAHPGLCGS